MGIDEFTGPLTAESISDWLIRCEEEFDAVDNANAYHNMSDGDKIHLAMKSLSSKAEATKSLHTWYTHNYKTLDKKDWDTFRDLLKDRALGGGWRTKVLQDFYTHNQGSSALDDYFEQFEKLKFTVARTSKLTEIDDMVYKCHVLFNSDPNLMEKFLRANKNDQHLIDCDVEDIMAKLKDYDGDDSVPSRSSSVPQSINTLQATAKVGLYITSGLFGTTPNTTGADAIFTTMMDLPTLSNSLGHLNSINCYYNNVVAKPQIQLFQLSFANVSGTKSYPATYHHTTNSISITLAADEFLVQVTMTHDSSNSAISSIRFKTSKNNENFIGNETGSKMTFTAPNGWRVVGFHGMSGSYVSDTTVTGSYRYPITKLGVIYAPK